jgi:RNA polymerase sigma-70 factor (ECF subfamily)
MAASQSLIDAVLEQGRQAHPAVELQAEALATFLGRRPEDAPAPSAEVAADLYLACACLAGDRQALRTLDERYLSLVPQFVARIESDGAGQAEIQQELRDRLLVERPDRVAKLNDYVGRGRLPSWLRVVATRIALDRRRAEKPTVDVSAAEALPSGDPEIGYLEHKYKEPFQAAFQTALSELEGRDRTVLRMHLVDELSIDRIGQVYDVHRATAARWLARARDNLFQLTRAHLKSELGVSQDEFASLVRLVRSQLDLSVCRLLKEGTEAAD